MDNLVWKEKVLNSKVGSKTKENDNKRERRGFYIYIYIYIYINIGSRKKTTLSSRQACFVISHSSVIPLKLSVI